MASRAGAAPTASSSSSTAFTPPPRLSSNLALLRDPSNVSDELWSENTEQAVVWLLSLHPPRAEDPTGAAAGSASGANGGRSKGKERAVDQDGVATDETLVHWFCGAKGAKGCWEPATFCIRLLGMKKQGEVATWREKFDFLISTCPACAGAFQRAKTEFRDRYLRHYKPEASIQNFTKGVDNIERGTVLAAFAAAGFDVPTGSWDAQDSHYHPSHAASLSHAPLPSVQTILTHPRFFENEDVLEMVLSGLPTTAPLPLPRHPSPGLLALRLHHSRLLREFAETQLARCTHQPSSEEYRAGGLGNILDSHLGVLASRDRGEVDAATGIRMHYTDQRKDFMEGIASCLSRLSADAIRVNLLKRANSLSASLDVVHLVASHLGDTGEHLEAVLACFKVLLERLGAHFWSVGDEKYEEVVLHAILDNPDFHDAFETDPLLAAASTSAKGPLDSPWLDWLPPFLLSVAHSPTLFTNSLALIASTFLDRLQQARFDPLARTRALQITLSLFTTVFLETDAPSASNSPSSSDEVVIAPAPTYPHAAAASKVLDLHAAMIANFAFSASFSGHEWTAAVDSARGFSLGMAKRDGKAVSRSIFSLATFSQQQLERERKEKKRLQRIAQGDAKAKQEPEAPPVPTPPSVSYTKALWDHAYENVREQDGKALVILLQLVAPTAQFEKLTSRTWSVKDLIRPQMKAVNDALTTLRDPIVNLLIDFSDERLDLLIDFLGQPGVVHQIIALLLSPVESVHNAAQGLVKQAFDVTTRRDVFRCLLAKWPEQTLRGLAAAIGTFQRSAKLLPEACGIAKRLVRCLQDVLDVLCAKTDGLLRDADFVRRGRDFRLSSKLLALWNFMGGALALLFKRTPDWALFFENDEMTEWMRDAILFGADMLDQIRTLETIMSGQSLDRSASGQLLKAGSPSKPSTNGASNESQTAASMIAALSDPLEELSAWLRLNDEDLLLHSYNLVMRMLGRFTRSGIALRDTVVARLKRMADKPADGVPRERRSTILREDQLLEIREALEDNEDAVKRRKSGGKKGTAEVLELSDDDVKPSTSSSSSSLRVQSKLTKSVAPPSSKSSSAAGRPAPAPAARSALTGPARMRGQPWTTYSSKKQEQSDEESSEDENVVRGADGKKLKGLALLAKDQTSKDSKPLIRKVEPRRTTKVFALDSKGQPSFDRGRAVNAGRSKEDLQALRAARLRSAQDFTRLHRSILQWDPANDGDVPPGVTPPRGLASDFKTPQDYFAAFEPLLLIECWEQVRQAKLEAVKEGQVIQTDIAGRQSVDDFVDVFCTIEHGQLRDRTFFSESDLVWLRQGDRQIFAKIQSVNRKREHIELTLRTHLGNDLHGAGPGLAPRTKWQMLKLANLSTVHREYAALQALEWVDLCGDILSPRPPPGTRAEPRTIQQMMAAYKVNEPQAMAIHGALRTDGFSLIQGPPGTGKTSTIVGLVGAFVDSRPRIAVPIAAGRPTDPSNTPPVAKVLLCAPSNAAVDEVAKRLKDGVRLMDGSLYVPKVVRIGADSAIDISVKDVFIDELVERAMSGNKSTTGTNDAQARMQSMRGEIDSLRVDRDHKKTEMDAVVDNDYYRGQLNLELRKIKSRIFELSQMLDSEKDKAQQSRRAMDAEQRKMRLKILSEADVICSTLSGAGHDYMAQLPFDFETVIIDEAAQSIELSSLIPLKYGCTRCILVGDPLQLPPTVISGVAARGGYDRSLFVRVMQRSPQAVHLLSIQYRMHPNISAFPSAAFYQSRLTDGPKMEDKTLQPWHANALFPPYCFYHVDGHEQAGRHHSWTNPTEVATALAIYERIKREYASIDFDYRIGIVTPYKGQVQELRRTFKQRYGDEILTKIAFNTVDGFQGQEKDIIILSCVRGGSADKGVGFLADTRRMNVALTRARSSIWILGDSNKLRSNQYWGNLVGDAETRGLFRKADINTFRSAYSAPPVVRSAVVKSHARAIEMAPAYGSSTASPAGGKFVAPTPPHIVPGSAAAAGPGPASALKKRLNDAMDIDSVGVSPSSKKPKTEDGEDAKPPAKAIAMGGAGRRPPPRPVGAGPGPSGALAVKKPPPSLFVPKKKTSSLPPPQGCVWRRSRFTEFLVTSTILLLVVWLAAAIALWRINLFLPVDYFGGNVDDDGGWWSSGQYNTLISVAGSFAGAAIGYGIGHGFKALLRKQLLSPGGISLYSYDALADMSQQQIRWHWQWSAVAALLLFVVMQLFDAATQAAFGTGVVQVNLTIPFRRPRISDNVNLLLPYLDNVSSLLSASDEADTNIDAAVTSLFPTPHDVQATILNTLELSSPEEPLFAAQTQLRLIQGVFLDEVENDLTPRETRMLRPSREIIAFAEVEGFFANAACEPFSPDYTTASSPTLNATAFSISFPCGTKSAYYWTNSPSGNAPAPPVADAFVCPAPSPILFLYSANPAPPEPSILFAYRCDLSTSSVLVPMTFSPLLRTARITRLPDPTSLAALPSSVGAVQLLAADLLDDFGPRGFVVLQQAFEVVDQRELNRTLFVQRAVETLVKVTLARASFVFTRAADVGAVQELRYETVESEFQVEALQLHLAGPTLYWLAPPILLLFLLLYVGSFVLVPSLARSAGAGRADFTDPTSVLLVALGSEGGRGEWERLRGGGTGNFGKGDEEREAGLRVRYGERVVRRKEEGEEGEPPVGRKLELTAAPRGEVEMRRPEVGVAYV
ncbi:hypothetical protein JCM6882_000552 [Rhodosporidiobolus microsporus]